jgi:hypothetical protein
MPLMANPYAYEAAPPPGMWLGLFLMIIPLGLWALMILYGLYGAARCLGGHDFRYTVIGKWVNG